MNHDGYCKFKNGLIGKIVRDVEICEPGFFTHGYAKFIVEDPKTGAQYAGTLKFG